MEAVQKLQNATKLLQKVTMGSRKGLGSTSETRDSASSLGQCVDYQGGSRAPQEEREWCLCCLSHLSEFSHPLQNNLSLLRDLAVHTAHSLRSSPDWGSVVTLHR